MQSKNFLVLYDGFPVTEPHVLIIPKQHRNSYSVIPKEQFGEVEELIATISKRMKKPYMVFEHGVAGQTVPHAHLHVMPIIKPVEDVIESTGVRGHRVDLQSLADVATLTKYLLFCDNGHWMAIVPEDDQEIEPGIITNTAARLLGVPYPANLRSKAKKEIINQYRLE